MADNTEVIITSDENPSVIVNTNDQTVVIITEGSQGPAGLPGDISLAFLISNKFYEIAGDEIAKQTARSNLGLDTIDGGTFF